MANLEFPNPLVSKTYTEAGITWTWNDTLGVWSTESVGGGGTPPNVGDGKLTINDFEGNLVGEFTANQVNDNTIILPEDQTGSGSGAAFLTVKSFGAKGDGSTDDTASIQAAFNQVSISGETLYFPEGTYMVSSKLTYSQAAYGAEIILSADAVIKATSSFPQNVKLIEATIIDSNEHVFVWKGGTIDGTQMPVRLSNAPDLLTIAHAGYTSVSITNTKFVLNYPDLSGSANQPPSIGNAGDSCLFLAKGKNFYVESCQFIGAVDAGIYISGDSAGDPKGQNAIVTNCYFAYCRQVGLITKRAFKNNVFNNNVIEYCGTGIANGTVSGANPEPGYKMLVDGNTITNPTGSGIAIRLSDHSVVSNNIIENPGLTANLDGSFNSWTDYACGIEIAGSVSVVVSGNSVFVDRAYDFSSTNNFGVRLSNYTNPANSQNIDAKHCAVTGNSFARLTFGVSDLFGSVEDPNALNNSIAYNHYRGVTNFNNFKHNGSFYQETVVDEGDYYLGFGSTPLLELHRDRPFRPGYAKIDVPLTVNGAVNSSNSRLMNNALAKIGLAADNQETDLQGFKNAIIEALSDITLEES